MLSKEDMSLRLSAKRKDIRSTVIEVWGERFHSSRINRQGRIMKEAKSRREGVKLMIQEERSIDIVW